MAPLSTQNVLKQIWRAFKQLNPGEVEEEARKTIKVAVIAPEELLSGTAEYLLAENLPAYEWARDVLYLLTPPVNDSVLRLIGKCDIVLSSHGYTDTLRGVAHERIFEFSNKNDLPEIIRQILKRSELNYTHLPLAREFPGTRDEISSNIISTVSMENTVFVISTSLGNIIPNPLQALASVAEAMGDLVVLTANQIRMLFQLAAANGKKVSYKDQAPLALSVIGAAFGWRSIAREAVSVLPLGIGIVPKAAIAFAGTWAMGESILYFFRTGKKLNRQQMKKAFDTAIGRGKKAAENIFARLKSVGSP